MKKSRVVLLIVGMAVIGGGVILAAGRAQTGEAPPPIGDIRPVASGRDVVLPFNEYRNSTAEVNTIERAAAVLAKDCMGRFGQEWTVSKSDAADSTVEADGGRYGVLDPAEVSQWGYHAPEAETKKSDDGQPTPSPDAIMVYTGEGMSALRGQAIPEGGCLGEARRTLAEGGPPSMSGAEFAELDLRIFSAAQADGRVGERMTRWRECMAESGYDYVDVWAANNDVRWSGLTANAQEIATATKDVACRSRTNLVPTWLAVETAYQQRVIAERADEFTALTASKRAWVDNASRVTSTR